MLDKLASVEAQYNYLMGLIADPAVQADAQAYRTHTKTLSELQELVDAYRSLKSLEEQLAQARELVAGGDADMAALAREELADLEPQHETLLEHVKFLLIPKDPNDAKNVVLEVRAGPAARKRRCLPPSCSACTRATPSARAGSSRSCPRATPMPAA